MRAITAFFTAISALSIALTSAAPTAPSLALRSYFDTNAHTTPAETTIPVSLPLRPRGNPHPIYISAANTRTYVILRAVIPIAGSAIHELLLTVSNTFDTYVQLGADRPIAGGAFDKGSPYYVMARNANNHQMTYGVLGKALHVLADWMSASGDALVRYEVWDGDNLVGKGLVGRYGMAEGVLRRRVG